MTIQRQWEVQLAVAVRMFLDHYWEDGYVDTPDEVAVWDHMLTELGKRMNGRFHDEWLALRAERDAQRKQDHADAGQRPLPPEKVQEARDFAREAAEAARSGV